MRSLLYCVPAPLNAALGMEGGTMDIEHLSQLIEKIESMNESELTKGICCPGIRIFSVIAVQKLKDIEDLNTHIQEVFVSRKQELDRKIKKMTRNLPEELIHPIYDELTPQLRINEVYPEIHRQSLVITIYNVLEFELSRLCGLFSEHLQSKLKLKDIHGNGTERAFTYLRKVVGIDFDDMQKEICFIKGANKVRNLIVHNGCMLPEQKSKELDNFVVRNENLEIKDGICLVVHDAFISQLVTMLIKFFEKLGEKIKVIPCQVNT